MSGDGGAAERAPLIDEEEEVQAVDPNLLTLMDCVWIMVHLCFATWCDTLICMYVCMCVCVCVCA